MWRMTRMVGLVIAVVLALEARGAASAGSIELSAMGHMYVGGHQIEVRGKAPRARMRAPELPPLQVDPNGTFTVGATYVAFAKLGHPKHKYPIIMMPGGGLSGAVYETTPDGRPGWQWHFLAAGYSTYIADLDQTGRSGWTRYPEINPDEPAFRTHAFMWEVFRIGPPESYAAPGGPSPYPGSQFPIAAFPAFVKQGQPRFRISEQEEAAIYDELVHSICPCILLTHSASGEGGMAAAVRWPSLIKAVISVEPSGAPAALSTHVPPHLFVWGDFLDPKLSDPSWAEEHDKAKAYHALLNAHGERSDWIELPLQGVHGNSHMLMLDRNSDAIASLIEAWLQKQGL